MTASALDRTSDDVARLTSELDALLARRVEAEGTSPGPLIGKSHGRPAAAPADGDVETFAWITDAAGDVAAEPGEGVRRAEQWVQKARRDRFSQRLRSTGAWMLTLGFVCGALVLSTFLILGYLPDPQEIGNFVLRVGS